MKKSIILKGAALLVVVFAVLSLTTCDQWINDEIMVVNNGINDIRVHIEFEDGGRTDYQVIPPGQNRSFFTAYWDDDKYTPISIFADDLVTDDLWEADGNIAANDWLTVVYFDEDFRHVY